MREDDSAGVLFPRPNSRFTKLNWNARISNIYIVTVAQLLASIAGDP